MGSQKMLVNVHEDETRIALTENNLLVDLHIEQTNRERRVGNIYCGTVVKINPAFQAAFIDYGESRNGFLSVSDLSPALLKAAKAQRGRARIQSVLKQGQPLMLQVLKEGIRAKGAALTTNVSLPGRYLVLTTETDRSGVSRKIGDSEKRGRLKEVVAGLMSDSNVGVIIRTAGYDRTPAELKRDLALLQKEWKGIDSGFAKSKKPRLLYQEPKSLLRVLRDYFNEDVEEVWVDSAAAYQEALSYFKAVLPKFQKRLKLYIGDKSLFSVHRIEEQIEELDSSRVPLKSGGGIVIEPTEALVTIDVNSGRSNQASDIEATALQTNMEAAEEVARQLRLRNLGGLIVIDFIDMGPAKNRQQVEKTLASAMSNDKARITFGRISEFGLLELSRQRIDVELSRGSRVRCENCGGTGHVPTVHMSANRVLRKIRELAAAGGYAEILGELPLGQANFLLNHRREALRDLEMEFELRITLTGNPALPDAHRARLVGKKAGEVEDADEPVTLEHETGEEAPREASRETSREEGAAPSRSRRRRRRRGGRRTQEHPAEEAASAQEPLEAEEAHADDEEELEMEEAAPAHDEDVEEFPTFAAEQEDDEDEELEAEDEEETVYAVEDVTEPDIGHRQAEEPLAELPPAISAELGGPPAPHGVFSNKRGGWLEQLNDDTIAAGETLFESAHEERDTGPLPVILPSFKRSNPFRDIEAEQSTVLFSSAHRDEGQAEGADAPEAASEKAATPKRGGRSRSRGRRGGAGKGGRTAGQA